VTIQPAALRPEPESVAVQVGWAGTSPKKKVVAVVDVADEPDVGRRDGVLHRHSEATLAVLPALSVAEQLTVVVFMP
jgi:hypothetical protein